MPFINGPWYYTNSSSQLIEKFIKFQKDIIECQNIINKNNMQYKLSSVTRNPDNN